MADYTGTICHSCDPSLSLRTMPNSGLHDSHSRLYARILHFEIALRFLRLAMNAVTYQCEGGGATKRLTMSNDLFGKAEPTRMELTIFCDERKMPKDEDGNEWWYICMLFIPTASVANVISGLMAIRDSHSFHKEIDSKRIKGASSNSPRTAVAIDWLRFLKNRTGRDIYWEVLGIATRDLDFSCFGPGDEPTGKYATVYNRFFRTAFLFSMNTYFASYDQVVISNVFHDTEGNLQKHDFFGWHLPTVVADDRI